MFKGIIKTCCILIITHIFQKTINKNIKIISAIRILLLHTGEIIKVQSYKKGVMK